MIAGANTTSHRSAWQDGAKGSRGRRANSAWATSRRKVPRNHQDKKLEDVSNVLLDNDIDMFQSSRIKDTSQCKGPSVAGNMGLFDDTILGSEDLLQIVQKTHPAFYEQKLRQ